jgi:hypothetical protein
MGFLLLEGAQRIIDQLKNDPDLIEMMRIPIDDPIKIQGEPSILELMQLEEITGSENPEVPPPQIISPGEISTQLEIERTSGRKSVPNPLFDLITIYNDEESSYVSLVTPMHITEEKEPERAYTPGPYAPVHSRLQSEHEVEISLDTNPLNI